MINNPKISVIIVSWNVADSLERCLKSIAETKYPNLEIIVIDNASTDDSLKIIKKSKNIIFIRNSKNNGFPKAVNQGLKKSTGDFLLLLNPDTIIPANFFTDSLSFFSNYPSAGIMGPKLSNPDGTSQGSVFHEQSIYSTFREFWLGQKGLTGKYSPDVNTPITVDAVSGACMLFPKVTLDRIGYFTESVFMYYEDLDYCRRIRSEGFKVYFNPHISVIHEHGSSSKKSALSRKYLWESSLWYNGFFKHYLMWFISWTGQKIRGAH